MAAAIPFITLGVTVLAGVVTGVGQYRQANEAADQAKAEGRRQFQEAYTAERRIRRRNAIVRSQMQANVAKVAVAYDGSPLEMLAQNTAELEREALDARQAGINARASYRHAASSLRSQGKMALATSILGGIAQGASSAYQTGAFNLAQPKPRTFSAPSIAYQQPTIYGGVAPRLSGSP